ncbi:uncharacterized protein BDZ99DRAFT_575131 [Mytilinidion resinicola]|uniref:Uncharacterized protein n=1 Tax=Mytilinidion resinicola TaxID=574789 RepID=A0A6A6Y7Y4_9PEZI|nr:uncharacterized protein BDZ99DRAFT_575131 [Mytilinidion resinicola]KAF2804951.1 hypothetical protein BDZ99DRAFT_575131 [Mytilinidion resinicola]
MQMLAEQRPWSLIFTGPSDISFLVKILSTNPEVRLITSPVASEPLIANELDKAVGPWNPHLFERESWPSHERLYELLFQPPDGDFPVCNYNVVQIPNAPIHDLRSLKDKLSLDREGFQVADLNTTMEYDDYFDQENLKTTYMAEIKAFLKDKLGARAAYVHECVSDGEGGHSGSFGQPIPNVHTDYTHGYALELIEQLTGDRTQAEAIKNSRIQILNIWKPL